MTLDDFIAAVFCTVDDFLIADLDGKRLRRRGPRPTVADSVVLTCELVGEFFGYDTDSGIFAYFRRHHGTLFPALLTIHRTTFARQAASLWKVKERLHAFLQRRGGGEFALRPVEREASPFEAAGPAVETREALSAQDLVDAVRQGRARTY